jgi:hypothetical protein
MLFNFGGEQPFIFGCGAAHFAWKFNKLDWDEFEACRLLDYIATDHPHVKRIMMDNDTAWSSKLVTAKMEAMNIERIEQPSVSPDLNVWDQSLNKLLDDTLYEFYKKHPAARTSNVNWLAKVSQVFHSKKYKDACVEKLCFGQTGSG